MRLRALLVLAVAYLVTAHLTGAGLVDDAYIFLRYARYIAEGAGAVFNAGERVEGYTSPLWLALLTPLFALSSEPSRLAMWLGAVLGFASIVIVARRRPFWNALLLATQPAFVFWSFSGMEAALTALLLLGAFIALIPASGATRPGRVGILLGLAILARPDCAWLVPVALAQLTLTARGPASLRIRQVAWLLAPIAAIVVSHLLWRHAYYGEWLPNTYFAKVGVDASTRLLSGGMYVAAVVSNLLPLATLYAISATPYRRAVGFTALAWLALLVLEGGDFFPYFRFAVPLLPIAAFGVGEIRWSASFARSRPRLVRYAGVFLLLANVNLFLGREREDAAREVRFAVGWSSVGRELARVSPPDATIATLTAGAIPYYSNRPTIDVLGLTDAHIARAGHVYTHGAVGHQKYDSAYVLGRQPAVIVLPESGRPMGDEPLPDSWPRYPRPQLRYGYALAHLVEQPETQATYELRTTRLGDGRLFAALWRTR